VNLFKILFCTLLFAAIEVKAQDVLDSLSRPSQQPESLLEYISHVEQRNKLRFFYKDEWLSPFIVEPEFSSLSIRETLKNTMQGSDVGFVFLYNYAVIFYKDPKRSLDRDSVINSAIDKRIKVENVIVGSKQLYNPGAKVTLRGFIKDRDGKSPLVGAAVYVNGLGVSTSTDVTGHFQLALPSGEYALSFTYVNYQEKMVSLTLYSDGLLNVDLDETPTVLDEVVISDQAITTKRVGHTSIKMADLNRTPSFMGEVDIIKMLQTQTGVSSVSEASTGFNVRGGGVDQNLVLFDGVPIFNTSHALGFFTAFNSDVIKEASLYKGGIPAEYGGRVSSVLNMTSREGSFTKWSGDTGIGIISGNLTAGGPIKRDTSSLIVSLRSTYSNWILNLLKTSYPAMQNSRVFFYDGSMKYVTKMKTGAKLSISSYVSQDRFRVANDSVNEWQNLTLAARYDHSWRKKLYYSVGLYIGQYSYKVSEADPTTAFSLRYKVSYPSLKIDFNKDGLHKQAFGLHSTFYNFKPGILKPTSTESNSKSITMPDENSFESAVYFSDAFHVGRLNIEGGLRLSMFNRMGAGRVYQYLEDAPKEPRNVVDSVQYGSGQIMKTYGGPEPRLSLRYTVNKLSSIKFGYNHIYQYVHLISNTASVTPVDIWQSSNTYFKPQIADQVSLGYFKNSPENMWEFSVDAYYKRIQNILDFKDGANLILNPKLETALLRGRGKTYGIEFAIEKTKGRLVGGLNYTYARSLRQVTSEFKNEEINDGNYYPSNYDQPHLVNLNWRYSLTRKIYFSGIFTYHKGRPISLPRIAYGLDNTPVIDFSNRNNYRLTDYHRLDIALIIEGNNRKRKIFEGSWTISIYNVYGRKNPYSAFFRYNGAGAPQAYQIALIGAPIPSVTYSLKF
jgi:hypothetical protein